MKAYLNTKNIVIAIGENDSKYPNCTSIEITEEDKVFIKNAKLPKYVNNEFVDTFVDIIEIPQKLSRMKFEMQVLITTGKEFEDIISFIQSLEMSNLYKKLLIIRLKGCTYLEREDDDLNIVSEMMLITQEQLDEIFIEGNKID